MKFLSTRAWLIRYRNAIAFGVLIGVLVTNFALIYSQNKISKQVLKVGEQIKSQIESDNKARKDARKDSEASDDLIISILECIAVINPPRNPNEVAECRQQANNKTTQVYIAPQEPQIAQPRITETTSAPPEKPEEPGIIERINTHIENILSNLDGLVNDVIR